MSALSKALNSSEFVVTSELTPPKGLDLVPLLEKAALLKPHVSAINLTESHAARMAMDPVAVGHLMLDEHAGNDEFLGGFPPGDFERLAGIDFLHLSVPGRSKQFLSVYGCTLFSSQPCVGTTKSSVVTLIGFLFCISNHLTVPAVACSQGFT